MDHKHKISVRNLVEFVLRSGDINASFLSNRRALEGIRLHQKIQKSYPSSFSKEVFLRWDYKKDERELTIEGRADGISYNEDRYLIDEIKSTQHHLEDLEEKSNPLHWAQVKFYGWMLCHIEKQKEIDLQLTYIHLETEETLSLKETYTLEELENFVDFVMEKYWNFQKLLYDFREKKQISLQNLSFPFPSFRKGQRDLAVSTYNMIQQKETLFVQAPTGIGKTMATLFPAIKSMESDLTQLIFYGTARSTQKSLAKNVHSQLKEKGLRIKSVVLTSKEKICANGEVRCNPKDCPYAKGHFDRVFDALIELYESEDIFDFETLSLFAEKHKVCPFELQLDLSDYCDLIIGDYNYIYHPQTSLNRLMENEKRMKGTTLLMDEAHNLVDRSRSMFSESLSKESILEALASSSLSKRLNQTLTHLFETVDSLIYGFSSLYKKFPFPLEQALEESRFAMNDFLSNIEEEPSDALLNLYFSILRWETLLLYYQEDSFVLYSEKELERLSLLCLDPRFPLEQINERFGGIVFFSATLQPFSYHKYMLGGKEKAPVLELESPFPKENFKILHPPSIPTTYQYRESSLKDVSQFMKEFTEAKKGNYLFFFPSYAYLDSVFEENQSWDSYGKKQTPHMDEKEQKEFLSAFYGEEPVHGYAVLGGMFSEGIDLVGDSLIGVVVLTIGLPGLSVERDLIKENFNEKGLPGYDIAYTIPGIIKVAQSGGRVIRSEKDKGQLLLIDQRFARRDIFSLLPHHWKIEPIGNIEEMKENIDNFWR
ncbi:ATP-dependent DNA helicase [Peptoniphilus sp. KCTC 25270]|uniref:ATP-dependent DNA helicase n=1 Tax=Peptoniphilus sp. KCTC 25270 TaxID=2897414 RepID=UPI001E2F277B|nr:ATP-dependent DNA helicase [Peptoniphilus sp. KCTC 25270]MCD1146769.1 ATP-dependent DNA helicase [Peptoniphilus sp. KCTC 25270]